MQVFLGFDPGGEGKFGWAVCIDEHDALNVLAAGTADHAKGALEESLRVIPEHASVIAAGIDAPMFWVTDGPRESDRLVRRAITLLGAPSPGGTVQHFNSLRGACVVQGLLILKLLRDSFHSLQITESHPKALLWLMGIASRNYEPSLVRLKDIKGITVGTKGFESEDERDAILGAFAAKMMLQKKPGWEDLIKYEKDPVLAGEPPIAYWMPIIK